MKKVLALLLVLTMSLALLVGCSDSKEESAGTLTLFTWEGMFPQEILDGFEKETGITINYQNFDYDETMLAKL